MTVYLYNNNGFNLCGTLAQIVKKTERDEVAKNKHVTITQSSHGKVKIIDKII